MEKQSFNIESVTRSKLDSRTTCMTVCCEATDDLGQKSMLVTGVTTKVSLQ